MMAKWNQAFAANPILVASVVTTLLFLMFAVLASHIVESKETGTRARIAVVLATVLALVLIGLMTAGTYLGLASILPEAEKNTSAQLSLTAQWLNSLAAVFAVGFAFLAFKLSLRQSMDARKEMAVIRQQQEAVRCQAEIAAKESMLVSLHSREARLAEYADHELATILEDYDAVMAISSELNESGAAASRWLANASKRAPSVTSIDPTIMSQIQQAASTVCGEKYGAGLQAIRNYGELAARVRAVEKHVHVANQLQIHLYGIAGLAWVTCQPSCKKLKMALPRPRDLVRRVRDAISLKHCDKVLQTCMRLSNWNDHKDNIAKAIAACAPTEDAEGLAERILEAAKLMGEMDKPASTMNLSEEKTDQGGPS